MYTVIIINDLSVDERRRINAAYTYIILYYIIMNMFNCFNEPERCTYTAHIMAGDGRCFYYARDVNKNKNMVHRVFGTGNIAR